MKILILNLFIHNFTGSEINAMQLCEGLKSLGHEADIGTLIHDSPMRELVAEKGIKVIYLFGNEPKLFDYDLIWAHHAPVLAYLLFKKQISDTRIIFSSLSSFAPLEAPPIFINDIYYYLSLNPINTKAMVKAGISEERIHNFPNYAPESFFRISKKNHLLTPHRIAVVSNHSPEEVRGFAELARQKEIQVDFFGNQDKQVFVDEALLINYDLVITIGKTIQYCFALKVPAYCYDHFGGPGYINKQNYEFSRIHNFSGKASEINRDEKELFSDIFTNYHKCLSDLDYLYRECQEDFCLETNLKAILNDVQNIPITNIQAFREKHILAERVYDAYLELLRHIFFPEERILINNKVPLRVVDFPESIQSRKFPNAFQRFASGRLFLNIKKISQKTSGLFMRIKGYRQNKQNYALLNTSELFDAKWYLQNNPDVAAAGMDPAWHYLLYGGFEGRNPGPNFSGDGYILENPDVKKAHMNPLVHYLLFGKEGNRSPTEKESLITSKKDLSNEGLGT